MSSMFHYLSPIEPANIRPRRTQQKYCEKPTTSNKWKNMMSRKLCRHESTADASYTWSNGSTTQNVKTGRKNHLTIFR